MSSFFFWFRTIGRRYRKVIIIIFILWGLWSFGLGALGSFFLLKGGLEKFPEIKKESRFLILAPHIDDEIISSAGLIQQALTIGAKVKIVYLTNGDDNVFSVLDLDKTLKLNPNEFIRLGEERMKEGKKATKILGLTENDLDFLGFPDGGLSSMLTKFYSEKTPFTSKGTRLSYNPYSGTYKKEQDYTGVNVVSFLKEIIDNFSPTIILVSHPRDKHPDHRATFQFLEKVISEKKSKPRIFAYLVHYSLFPPEKKYKPNDFLYPPRRLFTQTGWFSFDLTIEQENKKLQAVKQNASQIAPGHFYDFLQSFVKKNEIFEEIE